MRLRQLREGQEQEIANLQPDTLIRVYHGTDMKSAIDMVVNGLDARQRVRRLYPHYVGTSQGKAMVNRGLFVTHDLYTATTFGSGVIVQFSAPGKELFPMFPSPEKMRKEDQIWRDQYPNSFRPSVSASMLEGGAEPQALYRGLLDPEQIEKIHTTQYDAEGEWEQGRYGEIRWSADPEEFKKWYVELYEPKSGLDPGDKLAAKKTHIVKPRERITFEELVKRVQAMYPRMQLTAEHVTKFIERALSDVDSYEGQVYALASMGMGQNIMSYTAAKALLPDVLRKLGIPKAPGRKDTELYYG